MGSRESGAGAVEQGGEAVVAEILEQDEALGLVGGEDGGRAVAHAAQQACDAEEGADGIARRRVVHEHGRGRAEREPRVAPGRGIAGERMAFGLAPACAHDEGAALAHARAHGPGSRCPASTPASARARGPWGVTVTSRAPSPATVSRCT